jgi:hypothetical protein
MRLGQPKSLTVAQQYVNLRSNPVSAGSGYLHAGRFSWIYETSPSTLSRVYRIRIKMDQELWPDVFVDDPDLDALAGDGRDLPHIYHDPTRLCLHLPGTREWQPWMRLDLTIVPWTSLWLFYFEDWLASGEWKGGGVHPPATLRTRRGRRRFELGPYLDNERGSAT